MTAADLRERVAAITTMAALKGVAPPGYTPIDGLALSATSIGHKFGFDDGDTPDTVWDLLRDYGVTVPLGIGGWWHGVLWDLVHTHLVPVIDAHLRATGGDPLPRLHFMEWTNHNPVRFASDDTLSNLPPDLTVHVPWLDVLAYSVLAVEAARQSGGTEADTGTPRRLSISRQVVGAVP